MTGASSALGLVALVTHARTVPSEARERFVAPASRLSGDRRAILVHTCHRAELYALSELADALRCPSPADPLGLPELPAGGRRLEGRAAARHLLEVAAGLDSVVVGEDQILHQLRECYAGRQSSGITGAGGVACAPLDPLLGRLFQVALRVGRETRSWRDGRPTSLADVGLDIVERQTGPAGGRTILVVGAGKIGRFAALAAARRGWRILVLNRSQDRAAGLAADAGGSAVVLRDGEPLPGCDAIVVAISARWELGPATLDSLLDGARPLLDLSSPPALAAAVRESLGVRYVSIDDLAHGSPDHLRPGLRDRITRLIDESEAEFVAWVRGRSAVPAIQALSERAESQRVAELERLFRRLALDETDRALVEQMSHRLVAGLLHDPLTTLRDDRDEDVERAARRLFAL